MKGQGEGPETGESVVLWRTQEKTRRNRGQGEILGVEISC